MSCCGFKKIINLTCWFSDSTDLKIDLIFNFLLKYLQSMIYLVFLLSYLTNESQNEPVQS